MAKDRNRWRRAFARKLRRIWHGFGTAFVALAAFGPTAPPPPPPPPPPIEESDGDGDPPDRE
ncbi:MAG: hypothetical protein U0271_46900 [Polyangiaceae bacterium]